MAQKKKKPSRGKRCAAPRKRFSHRGKRVKREDELARVRALYSLPDSPVARSKVLAHLARNPFLLSFLVSSAEEIVNSFAHIPAYLGIALEYVNERLIVAVSSDAAPTEAMRAFDSFECDALDNMLREIESVRFDLDIS